MKTGLEKVKPPVKIINFLKEDKQAFGLLVGKAVSPDEAHSHPLTTVPLALACSKTDLRQTEKSPLRNHLIQGAQSLGTQSPLRACWIYDAMAVVRILEPCETWGEFADSFLNYCSASGVENALMITIAFDLYFESSVK